MDTATLTSEVEAPPASFAWPRRRYLAGRRDPVRPTRRVGPAGRVVVLGAVCFFVWGMLAAPGLRRSAQTSPLGLRRTAALAVLTPLARVSAALGLDRVQSAADGALGRRHAPAADESFLAEALPLRPPRPTAPRSPSSSRTPSASPVPTDDPASPAVSAGPSPTMGRSLAPPTKDDRLRVLLVGDSIGEDLGIGLSRLLDAKDTFVTKVDARQSTGLARPDYFNWPYQVAADMRAFGPDVVVAMFGANDDQGFLVADHGYALGTAGWTEIYERRVGRVMSEVTAAGRPLIWVGMPPMRSGGFSSTMRMLDAIYRSEALGHPGVVYLDSWPLFSGPGGRYAAYLPASSGREEQVRAADGVHLTVAGGARLAGQVFEMMRTFWQSPSPVPPSPATMASPSAQSPQAGKAGRIAG